MRILIVDDEPIMQKMLRKHLERVGRCDTVGDGRAALLAFDEAWTAEDPFDLICLDIEMPNIDGYEVLRAIRDREQARGLGDRAQVKIIVITAHTDPYSVVETIGCDGFIGKPLNGPALLEAIRLSGITD